MCKKRAKKLHNVAQITHASRIASYATLARVHSKISVSHAMFYKCNVVPMTAVTLTASICLKLNHTMNGLVIINRFSILSGNWDQTVFLNKSPILTPSGSILMWLHFAFRLRSLTVFYIFVYK